MASTARPDPTPEQWRRVCDVFDAVADLAPGERPAALARHCSDPHGAPDPALRAEVEALLAADDGDSLLDQPAAEAGAALVADGAAQATAVSREGERVGPWHVLREIGRGGMGAVYLVERADGAYEQQAALKRLARAEADGVRRFEQERQILAGLDHPGIARLLDGGMADDGTPYLVMEYVQGMPITRWADAHELDARARVTLFLQVCEAVSHAHRHLVVHRDLKPSNVLVAQADDGQPVVKLLDFGIARLLQDSDAASDALRTRTGLPLLTPEYAAPEQVTGAPITTATDVYALGVLLYELLAGQRPYTIARPTLSQIVEMVVDTRPAVPSLAAATPVRSRALRGDLDTVVMKALDKDPARRYPAADALAADLRRHLTGLPVEARAPTAAYRAVRFVQRHRGGVAAAALLVVALVGGTLATLWQAREARTAAAESEATADFLAGLLGAADPLAADRRDTLRVADLLDEGTARVRTELADQPRLQGRLLHVLGRTYRSVERWGESTPLLQEAVALYRESGAPPAQLSAALGDLALSISALGDHDAALPVALDGLAQAHASGDAHRILDAERAAGHVSLLVRGSPGADSLLAAALARARRLYGPDAQPVAEAQQAVGISYTNRGDGATAATHLRAAIETATRAMGPEHPMLIGLYHDLAVAHLFAGDPVASEAAERRGLALARRVAPGTNRMALALTGHAQALRRLGRLDEAEAELREALPLYRRRPADRAVPLGTLASLLAEKGDLETAIATQRTVVDLLAQDGSGPAALVRQSSVLKLAGFLTQAGRYPEAEALLLPLDARVDDRTHGPGADRRTWTVLADLYEAWGRPDRAADYRQRAGSAPAGTHGG